MELNKEEKKAIETLKEVASDDFDTLGDDISPKMAQNILNVIEKQQKDIEEKNIAINKMPKDISHQFKEIEEKSTIINQLLEDMKERANNFAFESEMMWRKIEKVEKSLKEN